MRTLPGHPTTILSTILSALPALLLAASATAQTYPTKPIRLIVPYPPAGTTDFVAREVGQKTGELLGQQIVIDNRPGAGTLIGLTQGARAAPDGYTITFGTSAGLAIIPALGTKMPFDPQRDFVPLGLMVYVPYFLVVNPTLPVRNVKELIDLAKAQPGKLNFASPGVGTPNHLGIEMLNMMAGVKFVHVPYKGGGAAVTDLLAGQVSMYFGTTPSTVPFVRSGRLRALAVTSAQRSRAAPDIPTLSEAALPGFEQSAWHGILAPAGTPAGVVNKLNAEIVRLLRQPDTIERMAAQGVDTIGNSPAEFAAFIKQDVVKYEKLVKSAGIRIE